MDKMVSIVHCISLGSLPIAMFDIDYEWLRGLRISVGEDFGEKQFVVNFFSSGAFNRKMK